MQTSKKRIMGAFGLASVAAMTIAAYNVPAPAAYANTSVPLTVTVQAQNVYTQITGSIHDGTQTAISPVDIQVIFSHASRLDYSVSISQGETTVEDIDTGSVDTSTIDGVTDQGDGYAGTYTASINLKQLLQNAGLNPNKKANFTFKVTGFSSTGGVSMGDAITFTYGQTAINPDDNINPDAEEGEGKGRPKEVPELVDKPPHERTTTVAVASDFTWLRVTKASEAPTRSRAARALGPRAKAGRPLSSLTTSMSASATPEKRPTPMALRKASLAAKRAAKCSPGRAVDSQ